ncbi:MAG: ferritin-like domain-containing protein [Steroidobacteraceae bacterium]
MREWLRPVQRFIWRDEQARARRLLRFADVEADGGRDLVRAAEITPDPVLRKLYLAHASDERRHANLFRDQGLRLLQGRRNSDPEAGFDPQWLTPGERGLDDVRVDEHDDATLLAFLHISEKNAARDFTIYRDALAHDAATQAVFDKVLRDEVFHMNYTAAQLQRIAREDSRRLLWHARLNRLWKAFVRLMAVLAGGIGTVVMLVQYFIVVPPFVLLARRAARREHEGWQPVTPPDEHSLKRQY